MSLKLSGDEVSLEKLESLLYAPGLQDSGDLETATRTVTATSKPGVADYTVSLTTPAPSDARIAVKRLALRLQVVIDSLNAGATALSYSVEVNGTERLTGSWSSSGAQNIGVDLQVGSQTNLGAANELKVYLWVDSGNAVVSLCQLWQAVGHCGSSGSSSVAQLQVTHRGLAMLQTFYPVVVGSGAGTMRFTMEPNRTINSATELDISAGGCLVLMSGTHNFGVDSTVATDLTYFRYFHIVLMSRQ